jgi:hypothetical protein
MPCREIIAFCSEIYTKHINSVCRRNMNFLNVETCSTYINHWDLKGYYAITKVKVELCVQRLYW